MAVLRISYDKLENAANQAAQNQKNCKVAMDELSKIMHRISSLEGNQSQNTIDAYNNIYKEMNEFKKYEIGNDWMNKNLNKLITTAKDADMEVARVIKEQLTDYAEEHGINLDDFKNTIIAFLSSVSGDNELFSLIGEIIDIRDLWFEKNLVDFRKWFETDGGEQVFKMLLGIGEIVVASIVLAVAIVIILMGGVTPGVVCGIVLAMMNYVDAIVNLQNERDAFCAVKEGNPAQAIIYSDRDTLSDVCRETVCEDKYGNIALDSFAGLWDTTKIVLGIIGFVTSFKNLSTNLKAIKDFFSNFDLDVSVLKWDFGKITQGSFETVEKTLNGLANIATGTLNTVNDSVEQIMDGHFDPAKTVQNLSDAVNTNLPDLYGGIVKEIEFCKDYFSKLSDELREDYSNVPSWQNTRFGVE